MNADIAQLELRLEDLETSEAAADPLPQQLAIIAVNEKAAKKPRSPSVARRTSS